MPVVKLPSTCSFLVPEKELTVEAGSLGELFEKLLLQHPNLKHIIDNDHKPKDFLNIFINDNSITPYNPHQKISHADKIVIMSAVSGG